MKSASRRVMSARHGVVIAALLLAASAGATPAGEGSPTVETAPPLVLKERGNFYVGGSVVEQTPIELGSFGNPGAGGPGKVVVDQMYVEFMVPEGASKPPIIMVHGSTLTGKSYDTTPDGRPGWFEYFVRHGYPTYVPDYVGRGRSGFNQALFNDVRAGLKMPKDLPEIRRQSQEVVWRNFRFGPKFGVPFPDEQFPIAAISKFYEQSIADLDQADPSFESSTKAFVELAHKLGGVILVGHSMGALFPTEVAVRDPDDVKAIVLIESCADGYTDVQIKRLSKIPLLVIWGDHIDSPTGIPGWSWRPMHERCRSMVQSINKAGGTAVIWDLPQMGIYGNSHAIMMDTNSHQIADMVMHWLDRHLTSSTKEAAEPNP